MKSTELLCFIAFIAGILVGWGIFLVRVARPLQQKLRTLKDELALRTISDFDVASGLDLEAMELEETPPGEREAKFGTPKQLRTIARVLRAGKPWTE